MGIERLREALRQHRRVGIDTSIFIYQLEDNARYTPLTGEIFSWLQRVPAEAVASTITMAELLVQPYRESDGRRVDAIYALLVSYPNLEWVAPTLRIADRGARLRAEHRLRTPDALQAATALDAGATAFLTNDRTLERVRELDVLVLDRIVGDRA